MKIAIISSGFLPVVDGVTVTQINRLQQLSQYGHQLLLFCPDYSQLANIYPNWQAYTGHILPGVRIVNLKSESFLGLDFERNVSRRSYQVVLQELQNFQPDIIHVDEPERLFTGFLKIPGIYYAKKADIPCVSFFHTNLLEYGKDYFNTPTVIDRIIRYILKFPLTWIYNAYDLTLVSNRVTQQKLTKLGIKNLLREELLGIDIAKFSPQLRQTDFFTNKYQLPNIEQKVKLIFLGRLTLDKGWNFTLDAFTKIAQEVNLDNIALIIAGDGSMRDRITEKLSAIIPHTYLLGRVSPDDVPALLINSDIHVTTSEKETKGLTILEAFSAGIPVLAPRAGGVVDSIDDGENGLLFTPQDKADFASKLKTLIDNSKLRQTMGIKAKESVAKYSWEQATKNLLKIWQQQIEDKSN
ncbi:glycosyl transferase [Alphaproteobacteria bacterium]|nr:glycosyl transferase [Alphaproteobacteria bacterium]